MDHQESKVLRRKVYLLQHRCNLDEDFIDECLKQSMLDKESAQNILAQPSENQKIRAFVISLEQQKDIAPFSKLCFLLERIGLHSITDEINAELLAEKELLELTKDVRSESQMLLSRLFKTDNVYSSLDVNTRRSIEQLLSNRILVSREVIRRAQSRLKQESTSMKKALQHDIQVISDDLVLVLKEKNDHIEDRLEVEDQGDEDEYVRLELPASVAFLRKQVASMNTIMDTILLEMERLDQGRDNCYALLEISPQERESQQLDHCLQDHLKLSTGEMGKLQEEIVERYKKSYSLDKQMKNMKLGLEKKLDLAWNEMDRARRVIREKDDKIQNLQNAMENQKRHEDSIHQETDYYKNKLEILEKTRKFGFALADTSDFMELTMNEIGNDKTIKEQKSNTNENLTKKSLNCDSGVATNSGSSLDSNTEDYMKSYYSIMNDTEGNERCDSAQLRKGYGTRVQSARRPNSRGTSSTNQNMDKCGEKSHGKNTSIKESGWHTKSAGSNSPVKSTGSMIEDPQKQSFVARSQSGSVIYKSSSRPQTPADGSGTLVLNFPDVRKSMRSAVTMKFSLAPYRNKSNPYLERVSSKFTSSIHNSESCHSSKSVMDQFGRCPTCGTMLIKKA